MKIYPAIDLKSGECVRLHQGSFEQVTYYSKDPIFMASSFAQQGATFLHIVDLDGAKQGKPVNSEIIVKIAQETALKVQTGGGIRTKEEIKAFIAKGIDRIVLGSIAILQPLLVKQWLHEFGAEKIVLALDIRMNENAEPTVAMQGWQTNSEISLWQLLDDYQDSPLQHILCTDIHRDGTLQGPNINLYKECCSRYPLYQFQASGGISSLKDLRALAQIPVAATIIGKALYEKQFSVQEALDEIKSC
jgi:phosphoribosylformimino-5-aminoimidazole carboxamide ribotide isomerase